MPNPKGVRIGGRQKGVPNRKTQALLEEAEAKGTTPLEVMLRVMRYFLDRADVCEDKDERSMCMERASEHASKAAPYLHPKLSSIEVGNQNGMPFVIEISQKDAQL
jgi:hypothetical protein